MSFTEKVLEVVRQIPSGAVKTYKQVAELAGNPKAARAVGTVLKNNTDLTVPCHRVICSNGELGDYNGLRGKTKAELLREENYV